MKRVKLVQGVVVFIIIMGMVYFSADAAPPTDLQLLQHQKPTLVERNTLLELQFSAPSINVSDVEDAYLFYKTDGNMAYSQKKASLVGSYFSAELTIDDEQASELEYYLRVDFNDGNSVTYPSDASDAPVRVEIVDPKKTDRQKLVEKTGVDYTILSPDPGVTVSQEDVVVALTLFYEPEEIDTSATFRMYVDGNEVTEQANASDYFYSYSTEDLSMGEHSATFEVETADSTYVLADWGFSVVAPGQMAGGFTGEAQQQSWMPQGNVELRARKQQVGGYPNDALSGNVRLSGQKGKVSYSAFGLLTTQEDPRLQPQNRYGLNLYIGNWLDLEAGHVYPTLNRFTIAGQRMQGVNAGLHAWNESLNLRLIYGSLRRGIDNIYNEITTEERTFEDSQQSVRSYLLNTDDAGTFQRKIAGARLGVQKDEAFNFGLNFIKVEDDTSSIRLIDDYNDVMEVNPNLAGSLAAQQKQALENDPDNLGISGNPSPRGNFVAASDLAVRLDNNRIEFEADAAMSLLNKDISDGALTQQAADRLGFEIAEDTENILDQLSWLIIVNENMDTLPIRFDEQASEISGEFFFPKSILAGQSQLGLSYFNNDLQLRYRWVGPGYNSLANTTVRKDIAGFSVRDRFRLFENQLYLTIGYENLRDNVIENKEATTSTINYRGNISWYPISQNLPRISLGVMKRNRNNEVSLNNPLVASISGISEQAAVQNITIQSGDTVTTTMPRFSDTYQFNASITQEFALLGITHDATINYSLLNTTDQVFEFGDSKSQSFSFRIVNHFDELPVQTNIGLNLNRSETSAGLNSVDILGANIGGSVFLFDGKLNMEMSLAYTQNRSETTPLVISDNDTPQLSIDDYYKPAPSKETSITKSNSYVVNTRTRYNLNDAHSLLLDFKYSNVQNTLASAVTFPNDHLLQMRYIYNF